MGGRVTRSPQSKELLRAKRLRQALESGASPSFPSPNHSQPPLEPVSSDPGIRRQIRNPTATDAGEDPLDLRRQYLEQLFESSPDALIVVDACFRAQCVNQEFQRMFGYSASQTLGQPYRLLSFFLPIAPPKPTGSRNACSAANSSPSKPSAAATMAPCSMFPFPPLP